MPRRIFGDNPIKCWDCNSSITDLHAKSCPKWIAGAMVPVNDAGMERIRSQKVFLSIPPVDPELEKVLVRSKLERDSQGHFSNEKAYTPSLKPLLPTDAKERKRIPLYSGLVKYFPDALIAVAALSQVGSDQHHPGQPLHWERDKSTDHEDTLLRHLMESGTVDTDGVRHSTKVAWRALAKLQLELEAAK